MNRSVYLFILFVFLLVTFFVLSKSFVQEKKVSSEKPRNTNVVENKCDTLEDEIKELMNDANYCSVDTDCTYEIAVGYPADCNPLVNINSDIKSIEEAYLNYANKCSPPIYDCDVHPSQNEMKCIDSRCIDTRYVN